MSACHSACVVHESVGKHACGDVFNGSEMSRLVLKNFKHDRGHNTNGDVPHDCALSGFAEGFSLAVRIFFKGYVVHLSSNNFSKSSIRGTSTFKSKRIIVEVLVRRSQDFYGLSSCQIRCCCFWD